MCLGPRLTEVQSNVNVRKVQREMRKKKKKRIMRSDSVLYVMRNNGKRVEKNNGILWYVILEFEPSKDIFVP